MGKGWPGCTRLGRPVAPSGWGAKSGFPILGP